jgi:phosphatidylserine/phosphatidylglycerophosphate/cardiolipin synthase-like enzyme
MKKIFLSLAICSGISASTPWMNDPGLWFFQQDSYYKENLEKRMLPVGQESFDSASRILVGQEEIYPRALEMIRDAKEQILFDMYLFGGEIADQMLEILDEKHKQGVIVRLILSPVRRSEKKEEVGNRTQIFESLYNESVEEQAIYSYPTPEGFTVQEEADDYVKPPYRPRVLKAIKMGLPVVHANPKFIPDGGLVKINHQKLLVVDGTRALVGGMNFATTVATNHDTMVEVSGPLIKELEHIFVNTWNLGFAKDDKSILHYNEERALADMQSLRSDNNWHFAKAKSTLTAPYLKNTKEVLIKEIAAASKSILIEQLLFNDTDTLKAVAEAAKRGVQVRIIVDPGTHLYGFDWKGGPNNKAVALVQALQEKFPGIDIDVRHYKIKHGQEMHCKLIVIDDKIVGLGSTNFTSGAFQSNYETFVFFEGDSLALAYREFFEKDWNTRGVVVEKLNGMHKLIGIFSDILF